MTKNISPAPELENPIGKLFVKKFFAGAGAEGIGAGYGPLLPDAGGILDLPEGFSYRVLSRTGDAMSDGLLVPGLPDAMAAFAGPQGRTLLVCNHELTAGALAVGAFGDTERARRTAGP